MEGMRDAFGEALQAGDAVRVRDGAFGGQVGEVVGYHWRPAYPKLRLTVLGSPVEVWFHRSELQRQQRAPG